MGKRFSMLQGAVVNDVKSDLASVVPRVPQGAVLGPLLFSLYINDTSADIESEIRLFVDDCICYRKIREQDILIHRKDIDRLENWARNLGIRLQPIKCNMVQLRTLLRVQCWKMLKASNTSV